MSSIREIALAKAIGGSGGSSVTVEELTATENKVYTAPEGKAYSPVKVNVTPPLQEKSVNANGDVTPDEGYYGLSKVLVEVPGGGGGTNQIYVSDILPSAADGNLYDLYVYRGSKSVSSLIAQTLTRKYAINITAVARGTMLAFTYFGAREFVFIFDDGTGNDVLLQDIDANFTYSGKLNKNTLFDKSLTNYTEASGIPDTEIVSLTVPAGYTLKGFKVGWRNDSSYKDIWRTFTITETFVDNGVEYSRTVLSEENMNVSQWDVGPYVDFTSDMVFPKTAMSNTIRYIKQSNGWTTINTLDDYLNYI